MLAHRPARRARRVRTRRASATSSPSACAGCTCSTRSPRCTSPRSRRRRRVRCDGVPASAGCAATVAARHLGLTTRASPGTVLARAEWQYAATRANLVPASGPARRRDDHDRGRRHRRRRHRTGRSPPSRRSPTTPSPATDTVSDATGHGTFVASVAAGSVATGSPLRGLRRRREADDRAGEPRRERLRRRRRGGGHRLGGRPRRADRQPQHRRRADIAGRARRDRATRSRTVCSSSRPPGTPDRAATCRPTRRRSSARTGSRSALDDHAASARRSRRSRAYVSLAAPGVRVLGATTATAPTSDYPRAASRQPRPLRLRHRDVVLGSPGRRRSALVWAANPGLTADGVIRSSSRRPPGTGKWNPATGYGVLDVAAAVAGALGAPAPPEPARRARSTRRARAGARRSARSRGRSRSTLPIVEVPSAQRLAISSAMPARMSGLDMRCAVEPRRPVDDHAVRVAEDDPRAHRDELVDEEQAVLEHLLEDQDRALAPASRRATAIDVRSAGNAGHGPSSIFGIWPPMSSRITSSWFGRHAHRVAARSRRERRAARTPAGSTRGRPARRPRS